MNPKLTTIRTKLAWTAILLATLFLYGPAYFFTVQQPYRLGDFFQEWASGRNYFEGLPIYTPQELTAWRYLRKRPDYTQQVFVQINGHPPACVLAALPLAKLDYATALWLWNGLSCLALVGVVAAVLQFETGSVRTWLWLPIVAMLLSNSLAQHLILGQLGIFLLALIFGAVVADERNRPITAGLLLGTATALKLFPGLLFVYFLLLRKWRVLGAGVVAVVAWNAASLALFGFETYEHFVRYSMPEVLHYRDWWANYSITGFWHKLFNPVSGQSLALRQNAALAQWGAWATIAVVVAAASRSVLKARGRRNAERAGLALFVVAMVLAAPIAWDHYFLFLLWPLVRLAVRSSRSLPQRALLFTSLFFVWLNPLVLFLLASKGTGIVTAQQVLTIVSWPFYALLVTFAMNWLQVVREAATASATAPTPALGLETAELQPAAGG